MVPKEIVLVDLSSAAYPIWAAIETDVRNGEPHPPNHASASIVDRVRKFAAAHEHVAICCDSGRSFRADIDPTYKGQRKEKDAVFIDQMNTAIEELKNLGFPTWSAPTFEADDLIASAVCHYTQMFDDVQVLIWSADKDLWQLIKPRVTCKSPNTGNVMDRAGVVAKKGVFPEQMCDFLCLVGDVSDNIKGAKNIGDTKAAALLSKFGTLDEVYVKLETVGAAAMGLVPSVAKSLVEFKPLRATVKGLVSLRFDVDLPFDEVLHPRTPKELPAFGFTSAPVDAPIIQDDTQMPSSPVFTHEETMAAIAPAVVEPVTAAPAAPTSTALAVRQVTDVTVVEQAGWEERSMIHVRELAKQAFDSRLFAAYGNPQAVYMVLLAGKERGLTPMQALMSMHIVEGKPTLPADLIRALVIKSGAAKYFRCTERTNERATFETQRGDDPPISLTYTILEATAAGLVKDKSGWVKSPADMLVARASAKLARLIYPDVVHGLYDELEFEREAA